MSVEFPYLRFSKKGPFRPFILVSVHYKKGTEKTVALIDSGADFTYIPLHIASKVGLSLKPKNIIPVHGVGGKVDAYKTQATLIFYIGDNEELTLNNVPVLVPTEPSFRHTLLGRDTIFQEFIISFDEYDKKVIFERKYH